MERAVLLIIPSRHQAAPWCKYAFKLQEALQVMTVIFPLIVGLIWGKQETKTYQTQGLYCTEAPVQFLTPTAGKPVWQTIPRSWYSQQT
jgi:hypothetical protein